MHSVLFKWESPSGCYLSGGQRYSFFAQPVVACEVHGRRCKNFVCSFGEGGCNSLSQSRVAASLPVGLAQLWACLRQLSNVEHLPENHIINPFLTKLDGSRCLDGYWPSSFLGVYGPRLRLSVHIKHAKRNLANTQVIQAS